MSSLGEFFLSWFRSVWVVLESSSLWLLIGFFLAGLVRIFLPQKAIERHLQGEGWLSVLKASALGVPLPLCSCSVIPVATSLRKQGASKGATASFLVSTPEIGVDSFLLSSALLGLPFAILRMVAAFVSAFTAGMLINAFSDSDPVVEKGEATPPHCCCHATEKAPSFLEKAKGVVEFGFVELLDDIVKSLFLGIFLAGLISAVLPVGYFENAGLEGIPAMLFMLLIALPLYVCATSSTPLASTFLAKGMDPGAVLVFLLVGPATNIATMLVVKDKLGTRALALYITALTVISLSFGYFLAGLLPVGNISAPGIAHEHHSLLQTITSVILVCLMFMSLFRAAKKREPKTCCKN